MFFFCKGSLQDETSVERRLHLSQSSQLIIRTCIDRLYDYFIVFTSYLNQKAAQYVSKSQKKK